MSARDALAALSRKNISVRLEDGELSLSAPTGMMTPDLIAELRPQKPALIAELKRRQHRDELLMMLADNPNVKYAYVTDTSADPVVVAIGIRGLATFEMTMPPGRYDPWKLAAIMDGEERGANEHGT